MVVLSFDVPLTVIVLFEGEVAEFAREGAFTSVPAKVSLEIRYFGVHFAAVAELADVIHEHAVGALPLLEDFHVIFLVHHLRLVSIIVFFTLSILCTILWKTGVYFFF